MKTYNKKCQSRFLSKSALIALSIMLFGFAQSAQAQQWTVPDANGNISNTNSGNVGIGTFSPQTKLHVNAGPANAAVRVDSASGITNASAGFLYMSSFGNNDRTTLSVNMYFDGAAWQTVQPSKASWLAQLSTGSDDVYKILRAPAGSSAFIQFFTIDPLGNVGIGTSSPTHKLDVSGDGRFTGNLTVDGNIAAKYQDVAEWVPSTEQFPGGTVVILDPTKSNQVTASSQAYDTRVAGVISEQPGIVLGERGTNKVLVATTGRVRVRVDASRAPIHIGDLLVTSNFPGVAMKSEPVNLGGVRIHRPGTLIGKAVEPLEKGSGTILVLLSLQ